MFRITGRDQSNVGKTSFQITQDKMPQSRALRDFAELNMHGMQRLCRFFERSTSEKRPQRTKFM